MKITIPKFQLKKIKRFVELARTNPEFDIISSATENPDCGLFIKQLDGSITDLPCLAVAITVDNYCLALNQWGHYCCFLPHQLA